jgi:hypothetical protein
MTKEPLIRRTTRTDHIILLKQNYTGRLKTPKAYNGVFANAIRCLADKIEAVDDAWVDPEIVVWLHVPGQVSAEASLSPPLRKKRRKSATRI